MRTNAEQLDHLKAVLAAATPGEWKVLRSAGFSVAADTKRVCDTWQEADADYIAALDPVTVALLIRDAEYFARTLDLCIVDDREIEQTLGKALGYPEGYPLVNKVDDGWVCVGEHVPATLAMEAARRIRKLEEKLAVMTEGIDAVLALTPECKFDHRGDCQVHKLAMGYCWAFRLSELL